MAQFTWLLSRLLDTPLPHPMKLETLIWSVSGKECVHMLVSRASHYSYLLSVCVYVCVCVCVCSNYGRADLSKRRFVKLVSQLDDNIMYLCMAQVGEVCVQ